MNDDAREITLTYYSDVLCVWAHIAQIRIDEVANQFPNKVRIQHRFCSVFGDTTFKIAQAWGDRGGYAGFGQHLQTAVQSYPHVRIHPEIWQLSRPVSSSPAHLVLKAVQRVHPDACQLVLNEMRVAFFEQCLDIARMPVLMELVSKAGLDTDPVKAQIENGGAFADLEADYRDQDLLKVQGSPSFLLNEGRQKLYGNIGYGVIEANIRELLRTPDSGAASWC